MILLVHVNVITNSSSDGVFKTPGWSSLNLSTPQEDFNTRILARMFPFTTCVSILRNGESPADWKQINGTMTFLIGPYNECQSHGGNLFEPRSKNAICIQMLGNVNSPDNADKQTEGEDSQVADVDRKMLDKLALPQIRLRLRSRFMSVSKGRRLRPSFSKRSVGVQLSVDQCYHSMTKLLLHRIGDWHFNIFSLDSLSGDRSLFYVANHLFQSYDLIRRFQLDSVRLIHFLSLVEQDYHDTNPYHNALHAADVTQSMHCFLQEKELKESTSDLEKMAAIVAALSHDLDHPGVNNTFLIVTSNHLATLYQNVSVLENHHYRSAMGILQETNLLSHLSSHQREDFVSLLKTLILATDITRQQEFLLKFSRYIESGEFEYRRNDEHRQFLLQIALKCADISNPCRPWKISQRWSLRICHEFFLQGDTERTLNIPVTPLCDRYGNTVANIQHGFITFVVSPLFKAWDKFIGTGLSAQMLSHVHNNQTKWKSIMDSGKEISNSDLEMLEEQLDSGKNELLEKVQNRDVKEYDLDVISKIPTEISLGTDVKILLATSNAEKTVQAELEEEEGKSEEDDVVENDVNLIYHYQTESEESGRCLSPVSEDGEFDSISTGNIRRYSAPYVIRKDLSFYLGLRKDLNMIPSHIHRRQSLPTTVMYIHGSSSSSSSVSCPSPRSLSMDALLTRPKISNLSTSMEMSFMSAGGDPHSFTPLKNQILMLQGGSLTRFTSNTNFRRASLDPVTLERPRISARSNMNSDLVIPPFRNARSNLQQPPSGLASSWPFVARRSTTNGSAQHRALSPASSTQSISNKSSLSYLNDDQKQSSQTSLPSEPKQ